MLVLPVAWYEALLFATCLSLSLVSVETTFSTNLLPLYNYNILVLITPLTLSSAGWLDDTYWSQLIQALHTFTSALNNCHHRHVRCNLQDYSQIGPMGMAFSWRGCSLQTIPPVGRRSPLLRTRGYVILWGNRGGSVGSTFDSAPMCCRFESHLRN